MYFIPLNGLKYLEVLREEMEEHQKTVSPCLGFMEQVTYFYGLFVIICILFF